jgi:hypothetical protein
VRALHTLDGNLRRGGHEPLRAVAERTLLRLALSTAR